MKNKIIFYLALPALMFSLLSCNIAIGDDGNQTIFGTGPAVEEDREVSAISRVELAMNGTLHISMGDATSLRVEAQDNLMEYIETDVRGDTLVIHTPDGVNVQGTRPLQYYLTVEELEGIEISSSGDIQAGDLTSTSFSIVISSSGDVSVDRLDCSTLNVKISSSGNLGISSGQVSDQKVNMSSSGNYRARDVASTTADVDITSSGSATIWVSDRLSGRISSSGNIYYAGNPEVDIRTTSSGNAVHTSR